MSAKRIAGACLAAALAAGCTVRPRVSDTGYAGTWRRGNDRVYSVVSIAREGDRYFFRPARAYADGKRKVACGWDGRCTESVEGRVVSEYAYDVRVDPATGHLWVEQKGREIVPEPREFRVLDELLLERQGTVLVACTAERNGEVYPPEARPRRYYDKVADAVAGTPRTGRR